MAKPVVTTQIDPTLIEQAREALEFGEEIPAAAVVRQALIKAIGDDAMSYEVKLGRPFKNHSS